MTVKDPMTMAEASRYLAMDERTLAHLAEDRQVPAVRGEGGWVFSRKSLQKWQALRHRASGKP